jgi:hypothetical protein
MYSSTDLNFRKSSYSQPEGQNCVEVADLPTPGVAVRDSQNPGQGHLVVPAAEWTTLLGAIRRGDV